MKEFLIKFHEDSLFRNSIYLMLATAALSGFGFFFWLISTHLATPDAIGIATALISAMNIIAILSLAGFDSAIVRFLPHSKEKNKKLNTGIIIVGIMAAILGTSFVLFIQTFSPQLIFIRDSFSMSILFVLFCIMSAINILTDAVFLAYRKTFFSLVINIIFSFVKMLLPFLFIWWGAFGIFTAAAIGQSFGFAISILAMIWKFDYRPKFSISWSIIKEVWDYCIGNYFAGVLNLLPMTILPLIITNHIGTKEAAYFYIVMMIANLLYVIPQATTRSLFAEGSHDEKSFGKNVKKSIRLISILLIPSIIVLILWGQKILSIFGDKYAEGGTFLTIISLSAITVGINSVLNSFFRVKRDIKALITMSLFYSASILGFTYNLINRGLPGIGAAWLIGTSISALAGIIIYRYYYTRNYHTLLSYLPYWRGFDDRWGECSIIILSKLKYFKAFILNGFKKKTLLFYPETPTNIHILYQVAHNLGYTISSNPNERAHAIFNFKDTTKRENDSVIENLGKEKEIINYKCTDISKERVDEVFEKVFGYKMTVDPRTYTGICVRKSNNNATHDGKLMECPTKPEEGYVYQKFIDTKDGDKNRAVDIRLHIFRDKIPFVAKRYKNLDNRFDNTLGADLYETHDILTPEEIEKVIIFCKEFGLDYGEIDTLRDTSDGKLYIVDVNNTPSGPRPGRHVTREDYNVYFKKMVDAFTQTFLPQ